MKEQIPLFSAAAANAGIDFLEPAKRVFDSHWYVLGNEVRAFEQEFAAYCGTGHCVGLANGTDALELGLRALGVGSGDEVLMAANAGFYGSTAAHLIGAKPRYADIDPRTLTLSIETVAAAFEQQLPKAVIVTHLYGLMADVEAIIDLARRADVPVIEDCAQAHGARRNGRMAGTLGSLGCFSFYPTKNLGALGDGGAIISDDDALVDRVRQLRQYGWGDKYRVDVAFGRNSRLDELQAALLRAKLPLLDHWNQQRRAIARSYNEAFSTLAMACPPSLGEDYVAHLYVVRSEARDDLRSKLAAHGVATDIHYPLADHLQPAYASERQGQLRETERACASVLSLPCYPGMPESHIHRVIEAVRDSVGHAA